MNPNEKKSTTIRITEEAKKKLDSARKKQSPSDYVEAMLDFFLITKLRPEDTEKLPMTTIKSGFDRVIAILRDIENKKINFIKEGVEILVRKNINKENDLTKISISEADISVQDVQELTNINTQLADRNRILESENARLEKELTIKNLETPTASIDYSSLLLDIKELNAWLNSQAEKDTLNRNLLIPKQVLQSYFTKLENLCS